MTSLIQRVRETRKQFKPRDIEEPVDFYWHRPVAGLLVFALRPTPITANQVTVASGVLGLLSGIAIGMAATGATWWLFVGTGLLFASVIFDCADGQLARLRGETSLAGRALDGAADIIAPVSVMHGIVVYFVSLGYLWYVVYPIGAVVGASYWVHSVQYDHAKNLYLNNTGPRYHSGQGAMVTKEDIDAEVARLEAAGKWVQAWVVLKFWGYTTRQRSGVDSIEKSVAPLAESEEERAMYRAMFAPLMRVTSNLGIGTHAFALVLGGLLAPWTHYSLWAAWFFIAGPLNIISFYAPARRRRLTSAFLARRDALRAARVDD